MKLKFSDKFRGQPSDFCDALTGYIIRCLHKPVVSYGNQLGTGHSFFETQEQFHYHLHMSINIFR